MGACEKLCELKVFFIYFLFLEEQANCWLYSGVIKGYNIVVVKEKDVMLWLLRNVGKVVIVCCGGCYRTSWVGSSPDLPSMFLYFCIFALDGSCNFCEGIDCSVLCLFQMRDLKAVGKKFVHVMYPRKSSALLRDCMCWGLRDLQRVLCLQGRGKIHWDRDSGVLNILF